MSGASFSITVDRDDVTDVLARLLAAAGDLSPALKNIGEYAASSTKDRIAREETPDGTPFAPLNPLYAKTKKGPGILRGESRTLSEIVWQLAGDGVAVGSNAIYAAIHQFGGVIKAKNAPALIFSMGGENFAVKSVTMPARPYLGVSKADEEEILGILLDHFELATGGAFEPL